jgi:hypothetical protein
LWSVHWTGRIWCGYASRAGKAAPAGQRRRIGKAVRLAMQQTVAYLVL